MGPNVIVTFAFAAIGVFKPPYINICLVILLTRHLVRSNARPSYSTRQVSNVKLSKALTLLGYVIKKLASSGILFIVMYFIM
jgi:hypothetical protein